MKIIKLTLLIIAVNRANRGSICLTGAEVAIENLIGVLIHLFSVQNKKKNKIVLPLVIPYFY